MASCIRLAVPADRPAIEAIVMAAYTPYVARIGRPPGPMLDDYGQLIEQGRVCVLDTDGVVHGLVVLIPEADALLLDNVAVDPARRGCGDGRRLLDYAEATALAGGYPTIRLYTHELMHENIGLYGRRGYMETHRAEARGFRRVFMAKRIG